MQGDLGVLKRFNNAVTLMLNASLSQLECYSAPQCKVATVSVPHFQPRIIHILILFQSKVGASAKRLNLKSSPAPFKKRFTPNSSAFSDNRSSASASGPRFSGPLRLPSSSHRLFCAVFTKATKCRSMSAEASGAAVAPWTAATA